MQKLIQKYKHRKRRAKHVELLNTRIASLHNEIVIASFKGEFQLNKNITIISGNIENKAKLLRKYNRRLKLINF
jgi:fumarate hydratase class II